MAFPTIDSLGIYTASGLSASHEGNFPAIVTAEQLLLIIISANPTGQVITLNETGWTTLHNVNDKNHSAGLFYKEAVGDEDGATFTVDLSASDEIVAYCLAISGWDTATAPVFSTLAEDDNSTPNPPSLTPGFGALDALWIVAVTADGSPVPVTAYPTNYDDNQNDDESSAGRASAMFATRNLNATSDDPETFTLTSADGTQAFTIAVPSGGAVFNVSLSEAVDAGDSYSAIGILAGSMSEPADVSDSQSATMIGQGSISEPVEPAESSSATKQTADSVAENVDLSESLSGAALVSRDLTENVDLSESQTAVIVQVVSLSENVEASDSYTSLARAAAAITEAADLGESWAATAVRIASLTDTVDLTDTWTGVVPVVLASIAEDVTAAASFAAALIARPSLTEQVDLSDAHSVILNAAASLTEQVDPADIQSALMVAGASFSEAVELADLWLGTIGEIAAAVQILVAARDRRLVAEPRDTLVIVKTRPRRIVVNKLN